MLHPRDARYLRSLRWRQPISILLGFALVVAGCSYGIWAGTRLQSPEPEPLVRFDPVQRLERLFSPYLERLQEVEAETEREADQELAAHSQATSRIVLFSVRFLLANALATLGLILLAAALAGRRLRAIAERLQRALGAAPDDPQGAGDPGAAPPDRSSGEPGGADGGEVA